MTGESLELMKEQIMSRNDEEYTMINKNIKNKCSQVKDEWINEKYTQVKTSEHWHNRYEVGMIKQVGTENTLFGINYNKKRTGTTDGMNTLESASMKT